MEKKFTDKILRLIENKISSEKEKNDLIEEIKNDKNLKTEFALLIKIKEQSREKLKMQLKQQAQIIEQQGVLTPADFLNSFSQAAFFKIGIDNAEDLPIDDETIDDFLENDDEEE